MGRFQNNIPSNEVTNFLSKMKEEELNDLKYRELQKLAKEHGVKANLPKAGLIEALLEVFGKNNDCTDLVEEARVESAPPTLQENLQTDTSSEDEGKFQENAPEEEKLDLPESSEEKIPDNAPNSRRNSRKRNSKVEAEIQSENLEKENLGQSKNDNQVPKSSVNSRRNSRKKNPEANAKKSFDQNEFDNEIAKVEQLTNDIINNMPPRKRSARNSSSVEAAANQIDTTEILSDVEMNKSVQASRRNSRISRLFDKEAFDIEAAI